MNWVTYNIRVGRETHRYQHGVQGLRLGHRPLHWNQMSMHLRQRQRKQHSFYCLHLEPVRKG